ncbi:hypothetical protein ACQUEE_00870 [Enterococcus casseliflavus]|uniref:hypothetical protein n=1 Tax=Enterococcus casseliflavus TaxID=37734 RepID=UPI003D0AD53E
MFKNESWFDKMDLFLSWSTDRSKKLACIFNNWVTKVIPQLEVYYSPNDIQPGERWSDSIKDGLKGNPMGIFFVVEENIVQPWLNFEAGAISNQVGNTNVIPLLHDIEPSRITGPLTQFQAIAYNKDDFRRLIRLINVNITDVRQIDQSILDEIFDKWYPDFENQYEKFKTENPSPEVKEVSGTLDEDGQLSEVLSILRSMERNSLNNSLVDRPQRINENTIYYQNNLFNEIEELEVVDPIRYKIAIRNIELEYDEFIIEIKKWAFSYNGKINLKRINRNSKGTYYVTIELAETYNNSSLTINSITKDLYSLLPSKTKITIL